MSLRSLCKTVLGDTGPNTNSAVDRAKCLIDICAQLSTKANKSEPSEARRVDPAKIAQVRI